MRKHQDILIAHGAPELPAGYFYDVYPYDSTTLTAEVRKRVLWFFSREVGIAYGSNSWAVQGAAGLCKSAYDDWQQRQGWRHRDSV